MSPDLKLATVFVIPLGGKDGGPVLKALEAHRKFLRTEIAKRVNLKFAPDVRFRVDTSLDTVAKFDAVFFSDKVQRDLAPTGHDEDEAIPERDTETDRSS